jgi:hypothetical protein
LPPVEESAAVVPDPSSNFHHPIRLASVLGSHAARLAWASPNTKTNMIKQINFLDMIDLLYTQVANPVFSGTVNWLSCTNPRLGVGPAFAWTAQLNKLPPTFGLLPEKVASYGTRRYLLPWDKSRVSKM